MDNEEWRPVPVAEYSDHYEVSNLGRVRRTKVVPGCRAGRILTASPDRRGRLTVHMCANHAPRRFPVHILVLTAFVGPRPDDLVGCHNDGDRANNRLSNLRWDTQKENIADIRRHGRVLDGEKNHRARLTDDSVRSIKERIRSGERHGTIAADYSVAIATIHHIASGRNWSHIG